MGYVTMWTSIQGLKNMTRNKQFFGYSEKSKLNKIQITIPYTAVMTFEDLRTGEIQFICYQKGLRL